MGKTLSGLAVALAFTGTIAAAQNYGTSNVTIARDGAPAANVRVLVQPLNGAGTVVGTTGAAGDLAFALSLVNKPSARFQVVMYDCENGEQIVVFVEVGADAPEKDDCKKTILAVVSVRAGSSVVLDLSRRTVQTTGGQGLLGTRNGKLLAGGGAAAAALVVWNATGGDSNSPNSTGNQSPAGAFNPSGNYLVTNIVASDPGGHREFIGMESSTVLTVNVTGTTIRITCPPGSKYTLITATFNPSTGQITNGEGRANVAGFSNVLYRLIGSIALSGANQGTLTLQLTIGAGGEFPGGQSTVYNATGRKQ
jgi:hypothetical protein